jgi:spermidine synthase
MRSRALIHVSFFASGFAALLYQVSWERLLALFSGSDSTSVTIVVSAFLAGLGIGSLGGGMAADRLSRAAALRAFVAANVLVAGYALASKFIFYDVIFRQLHLRSESHVVVLVVAFLALLIPTVAMGSTLPLLARVVVDDVKNAPRLVGSLYTADVCGAAVGCFVGTWFIISTLGLQGATLVGAAVSLGAAATAVVAMASAALSDVAPSGVTTSAASLHIAKWCGVYFLTGFLAVGLEMMWIRVFAIKFEGMAYTFGHIVFVYLAANGLGLFVGSRRVDRAANPASVFFLLQFAAVACAVIALVGLLAVLRWEANNYMRSSSPADLFKMFAGFRIFFSFQEAIRGWSQYGFFLIALPFLLVGPPAFLFGYSFPFIQRVTQGDATHVGRAVGFLMVSNITGNALGGLVTGLLLLGWLGTANTLRLFLIASTILLVLGVNRMRGAARRNVIMAGTAAIVAGTLFMPTNSAFWMLISGREWAYDQKVVREDRNNVVQLLASGEVVALYMTGYEQGTIPFSETHVNLGAAGELMHPAPVDVLNIGFGSGGTSYSAGFNPATRHITVLEIVPGLYQAYRDLVQQRAMPAITTMFADSRYEFIVGDGRIFLSNTSRRFDVVQQDPLISYTSGSGFLNSREYFELIRSRLAPGGLAVVWASGTRTLPTFRSVFPHGLVIHSTIVGSNEPIARDNVRVESLLQGEGARAYFDRAGVSTGKLLAFMTEDPGASWDRVEKRARPETINTDLFPRDEYFLNGRR